MLKLPKNITVGSVLCPAAFPELNVLLCNKFTKLSDINVHEIVFILGVVWTYGTFGVDVYERHQGMHHWIMDNSYKLGVCPVLKVSGL